MEEKIMTKHPDKGKAGVNISRRKYEVMRNTILEALHTHDEITFNDLAADVERRLAGRFDGSVSWYFTTVKLDLEARKLIKRVPKTSPQRIRLSKK